MSDEPKIDVTEDHDEQGNWVVRGHGHQATTLAGLAKLLNVSEERLCLILNPKLGRRERNRNQMARDVDFPIFGSDEDR